MRNYEKKINQLGLQKGTFSKSLNEEIRDFEEAENEYSELYNKFKGLSESDDEYEEMESDVQEAWNALGQEDLELAIKVQNWFDKRDYYAAKVEHMKRKTIEKRAGGSVSGSSQYVNDNQSSSVSGSVNGNKKSGGSWLLWGGLGLIGLLVGVNVMKNRD